MARRSILQFKNYRRRVLTGADNSSSNCDVFINHRGIDTKRNVAGLLHNNLSRLNVRSFLDRESMRPGDNLFEKINNAIRNCRVGVTIFSPNYCNSYFCLHELALIMECKKKVIPIFYDVKPSELRVLDGNGQRSPDELWRFRCALDEARYTVGITFDSINGNWSDLMTNATDIILKTLDEEEHIYQQEQLGAVPPKNTTDHTNNI
ncbi:hypothetical protein Sjap_025581 [Stephania japonica]|uniref:TIR domain-containing protein n=1 Tax=Stephania japonica TaxID=461633 RepID=A0AAP0HJP6_9MAGN